MTAMFPQKLLHEEVLKALENNVFFHIEMKEFELRNGLDCRELSAGIR